MTDILERLREEGLGFGIGPALLCQQAAEEIFAMRSELAATRDEHEASVLGYEIACDILEEEGEALRAENARLREKDLATSEMLNAISYALEQSRAENARLREALKNWDALIRHQYTGSKAAMSDMTECAQETAKLLFGDGPWPKIEARAAMGESDE